MNRVRIAALLARAAALFAVAAIGFVGYDVARDYLRPTLAAGQKPIVPIILGPTHWEQRLGVKRSLRFVLSDHEEYATERCIAIAQKIRRHLRSQAPFGNDHLRQELEGYTRLPAVRFYAEHVLAAWHKLHGDEARFRELQQQALAHAPVVLVQRYQTAIGAPLAGALVRRFNIECSRMQRGVQEAGLRLEFVALTTDEEGAIRVPVFDTVYRRVSNTNPAGLHASYERLGYFWRASRYAELPVAVAREFPLDGQAPIAHIARVGGIPLLP